MLVLNNIGPTTGICAKPGMGTRGNNGGLLSAWLVCKNFCEMKAVIPAEKMLITMIVLAGFIGRGQAPAADGEPYDKE